MGDDIRNFLKGLLFLALPVGLQLLSNYLTQKREDEVFQYKVEEAVRKEVSKLLQAPKDI